MESRFPRYKGKWPEWYYIATLNGRPVLRDGQVPIYWRKKVAAEDFKDWTGVKIERCRVVISRS